mmetsp:Transcript_24866/g.53644  ORF Transcript_24866/g.53644 Transcript_24866/m.53644 type:complete len:466 (-) Transcript_24866:27-1424(-)
MPHFLCFADLSFSRNKNGSANENNIVNNEGKSLLTATATTSAAESATQTIDTSAPDETAGGSGKHATSFFVREENKKSSFVLQHAFRLVCESEHQLQDGNDVLKSAHAPANDNGGADEVNNHDQHQMEGETAVAGKKYTLMAAASITSCISTNNSGSESPKYTPGALETFLFGGFELITNVKTVEVYVIRSNDASKTSKPEEETYLTTCKGVPLRDLPPLTATALFVDGTSPDGESEERSHALDEDISKKKDHDTFYKFIFVSPGGPKPMKKVRLKFVTSNTLSVHGSIIVRVFKVKGRLADTIPTSNASQKQSMPQPSLPIGTAKFNPGMLNEGSRDNNMNSLASMMAMMGGSGAMPMAMNSQQQQLRQLQVQPSNQQFVQQQQYVQQQNDHQQEKNQAEIISAIAGLGMFLKSSEERTMNKFESMLTKMEMRINERLDNFDKRLDGIEQSINNLNSNELGSHE